MHKCMGELTSFFLIFLCPAVMSHIWEQKHHVFNPPLSWFTGKTGAFTQLKYHVCGSVSMWTTEGIFPWNAVAVLKIWCFELDMKATTNGWKSSPYLSCGLSVKSERPSESRLTDGFWAVDLVPQNQDGHVWDGLVCQQSLEGDWQI